MSTTPTNEQPDTAVSYVLSSLDLIAEIGVNREEVLEGSGLTSKELANIDGFVSSSKVLKLVENIERVTGVEGTGLFFGSRLGYSHHGMLGVAAFSKGTLREAVDTLIGFAQSRFLGVEFSHLDYGEYSGVGVELNVPNEKFEIYLSEVIFSTLFRHISSLSNSDTSGGKIKFRHSKPSYHQLYKNLFGVEVEFDAGCYELLMKTEEFNKDLSFPGIETFESATQIVQNQMPVLQKTSLYEKVKSVVDRSESIPTIDAMADRFNVSVRTLRRKLSDRGITYKIMSNERKCALAEAYLSDGSRSISEIARQLDFSNASSFTKAFTKWKGVSPKIYRESNSRT